jgi:hypothetical protein
MINNVNAANAASAANDTSKVINFAIDFRGSFPKVADSYVTDDSVLHKTAKQDLDTINESIEKYMILRDLLVDLGDNIKSCSKKYHENKAAMTKVINGLGYDGAGTSSTTELPTLPLMDYLSDTNDQLYNVPIAGNNILQAIIVDDKNAVTQSAPLYYIRPLNKFAFRVNGHLMLGNIGEVYVYEKNPEKIKVCARGKHCKNISTCTYYHPDTKDVRNYISGGFVYRGRNSKTTGDTPGRKMGNRSTLKNDIASASKEDIQLFNDQCMHDFLCNLIINETGNQEISR